MRCKVFSDRGFPRLSTCLLFLALTSFACPRVREIAVDSNVLIAAKGNEVGNTPYAFSFDGQVLSKDIVFLGRGTVTGTVLDGASDNLPTGANIVLRATILKDGAGTAGGCTRRRPV